MKPRLGDDERSGRLVLGEPAPTTGSFSISAGGGRIVVAIRDRRTGSSPRRNVRDAPPRPGEDRR